MKEMSTLTFPNKAEPYEIVDAAARSDIANLKANYQIKSVSATLRASGWSGTTQTISVTGMTEGQNGIIGIAPGATQGQVESLGGAGLYIKAQANESLTVEATGDVPTIDIPVAIVLFP